MHAPYLAAVVQLQSGADKAANLEAAEAWIARAAEAGAKLVALPELFNQLTSGALMADAAEPIPGTTSQRMARLAERWKIHLLAGSIAERAPAPRKFFNTALLFGPQGELLARYRKIHRFDVDLPGRVSYRESAHVERGDELVAHPTALGNLGLAICYDLRFPGLFSGLAARGAELLLVPSAFAEGTGRDHWEILIRARAIESQCYVLAPNQHGRHGPDLTTFGHSMIVDPWGRVLDCVVEGAGFALATIDLAELHALRARLPALRHRLPRLDG